MWAPCSPAADLFTQKFEGTAWRSKPSWHIVASRDRTVQPELQRFVAKRMGATAVETASSHVPMLAHPALVLDRRPQGRKRRSKGLKAGVQSGLEGNSNNCVIGPDRL